MRIEVIGRNLDVTDAIRNHAEQKGGKLTQYFDRIQQITFRLSRVGHQHHGKFEVELVCDVEHHADFVAKVEDEDLYVALDHAVQKASRQLTEFKERLKNGKR